MATNFPLASAGAREPTQRPKPIPRSIKAAIELMICGVEGVEDGAPMDLVAAARAAGVKPPVLRRYLNRPAVIQYIRTERRAFRQSLLAGNDAALKRIRDTSQNGMAVIASVRQIEAMEAVDTGGGSLVAGSAGSPFSIIIISPTPPQAQPTTIDVTPDKSPPTPDWGIDKG